MHCQDDNQIQRLKPSHGVACMNPCLNVHIVVCRYKSGALTQGAAADYGMFVLGYAVAKLQGTRMHVHQRCRP